MVPRFWLDPLGRWSCHLLGWGRPGRNKTVRKAESRALFWTCCVSDVLISRSIQERSSACKCGALLGGGSPLAAIGYLHLGKWMGHLGDARGCRSSCRIIPTCGRPRRKGNQKRSGDEIGKRGGKMTTRVRCLGKGGCSKSGVPHPPRPQTGACRTLGHTARGKHQARD